MKMKLYNIRKVFTCCIPTKQSENNEMDRYNPLMESPTFIKNCQNNAEEKTNKETIYLGSLIEMNEEDKKRLADTLMRQYLEEYDSINIRKTFTCFIPTKQSENNPQHHNVKDKYNHLNY